MDNVSTPKLLVVDDQYEYAEFVAEIAEIYGFDTTVLRDSRRFEEVFASDDYDLVILDLLMPYKDGIEILRYLAEIASEVKLILMSGYDKSVLNVAHQLATEHALNIINHITKPFRIDELGALLQQGVENQYNRPRGNREYNHSIEDVKNAVYNHEFCFYYQPQVSLADNKVCGYEALARWQHPVYKLITPDGFIGFIEENDLIDEMTMSLIDRGLEEFVSVAEENPDLTLSINISPQQLRNLQLPDILSEKVAEHKLTSSQIIIEVTESGVIADLKVALDILARFRMKGFQLSIDDFGTGTAMYEQLRRLPITELKIDRSFIANCLNDDKSKAIVEQTIALSHRLNIKTVAEGIETTAIENYLKQQACDTGQGYLYSKPIPFQLIVET